MDDTMSRRDTMHDKFRRHTQATIRFSEDQKAHITP